MRDVIWFISIIVVGNVVILGSTIVGSVLLLRAMGVHI